MEIIWVSRICSGSHIYRHCYHASLHPGAPSITPSQSPSHPPYPDGNHAPKCTSTPQSDQPCYTDHPPSERHAAVNANSVHSAPDSAPHLALGSSQDYAPRPLHSAVFSSDASLWYIVRRRQRRPARSGREMKTRLFGRHRFAASASTSGHVLGDSLRCRDVLRIVVSICVGARSAEVVSWGGCRPRWCQDWFRICGLVSYGMWRVCWKILHSSKSVSNADPCK